MKLISQTHLAASRSVNNPTSLYLSSCSSSSNSSSSAKGLKPVPVPVPVVTSWSNWIEWFLFVRLIGLPKKKQRAAVIALQDINIDLTNRGFNDNIHTSNVGTLQSTIIANAPMIGLRICTEHGWLVDGILVSISSSSTTTTTTTTGTPHLPLQRTTTTTTTTNADVNVNQTQIHQKIVDWMSQCADVWMNSSHRRHDSKGSGNRASGYCLAISSTPLILVPHRRQCIDLCIYNVCKLILHLPILKLKQLANPTLAPSMLMLIGESEIDATPATFILPCGLSVSATKIPSPIATADFDDQPPELSAGLGSSSNTRNNSNSSSSCSSSNIHWVSVPTGGSCAVTDVVFMMGYMWAMFASPSMNSAPISSSSSSSICSEMNVYLSMLAVNDVVLLTDCMLNRLHVSYPNPQTTTETVTSAGAGVGANASATVIATSTNSVPMNSEFLSWYVSLGMCAASLIHLATDYAIKHNHNTDFTSTDDDANADAMFPTRIESLLTNQSANERLFVTIRLVCQKLHRSTAATTIATTAATATTIAIAHSKQYVDFRNELTTLLHVYVPVHLVTIALKIFDHCCGTINTLMWYH